MLKMTPQLQLIQNVVAKNKQERVNNKIGSKQHRMHIFTLCLPVSYFRYLFTELWLGPESRVALSEIVLTGVWVWHQLKHE